MFVTVCSSVAPGSNGYTTFSALTSAQNELTQGLIGITDATNIDILNKGNFLNQNDLQYVGSQYFDNNLCISQAVYPIIFANNVKRAIAGDVSQGGFMFQTGNSYNLVLNPDSSWSNGTYVVDCWTFFYKDCYINNKTITASAYSQ